MPRLSIPEPLRRFLESAEPELEVPIIFLNEFPSWIQKKYPALYPVMFDSHSTTAPRMSGFLNLYLENQSVTHQLSEAVPLSDFSALRLVTSISGG